MKVFISHSSYDKWVARQMVRLLEEGGHDTFLDEKDIKTGDSIDAKIQEHLKDSDHLILLLSPASIKSQWVFIELGGAKALGKKVIPILFHLGANEIPPVISQLLARDINDFDTYLAELGVHQVPPKPTRRRAKLPKSVDGIQIGDKVRIVQVEHLTSEDKDRSPKWVSDMDKYSGVTTKVTGITKVGNLLLAVDNGVFKWSPAWVSKDV